MARLTSREIKILDGIFQMTNGYVLDFSNQSFNDFIFDAVKVDMDEERFKTNGSSKAKRLKTFIEIEEPYNEKSRFLSGITALKLQQVFEIP